MNKKNSKIVADFIGVDDLGKKEEEIIVNLMRTRKILEYLGWIFVVEVDNLNPDSCFRVNIRYYNQFLLIAKDISLSEWRNYASCSCPAHYDSAAWVNTFAFVIQDIRGNGDERTVLGNEFEHKYFV